MAGRESDLGEHYNYQAEIIPVYPGGAKIYRSVSLRSVEWANTPCVECRDPQIPTYANLEWAAKPADSGDSAPSELDGIKLSYRVHMPQMTCSSCTCTAESEQGARLLEVDKEVVEGYLQEFLPTTGLVLIPGVASIRATSLVASETIERLRHERNSKE